MIPGAPPSTPIPGTTPPIRRKGLLARLGISAAPALLLAAATASSASAQRVLRDADDWTLELGGYVRALTAVQDRGYAVPDGESRSWRDTGV